MTAQENWKISSTQDFLHPFPLESLVPQKSLKINFNSMGLGLNGGNRVILELACRLQSKGHSVSINAIGKDGDAHWFGDLDGIQINFAFPSKITRLLHQKVRKQSFRDVQAELLTEMVSDCDCDINIATYCLTADPTVKSGNGQLFYLVQNYEPLFFTDKRFITKAEKSYALPLTKLCVSKWLQKKVGGIYIGNGVNTQIFHQQNKFNEKEQNSVLYLYRGIPWKGDYLAIETLHHLFTLNPNTKIHIVAKNALPETGFPYELHTNVSDKELVKLYSKTKVLLYTSKFEGFGLPPLEALSCGTNVVSTNFEGNEYLVNGANCLMAENKYDLARQIQKLLSNDELAQEQLSEGSLTVKAFDFDEVVNRVLLAFGGSQ